MSDANLLAFLAMGLDSNLAKKAIEKGYTIDALKVAPEAKLLEDFESSEVEKKLQNMRTEPIPTELIEKLLDKSASRCCICFDFNKESAIVVHPITTEAPASPAAEDQWVILCNDHRLLTETIWFTSPHPLVPDLIRTRKQEWEAVISHQKHHPEDFSTFGLTSDLEALRLLKYLLDSPSIHRPFILEGNLDEFLHIASVIVNAFDTGIIQPSEHAEKKQIKKWNEFMNPNWREMLKIIRDRFAVLQERINLSTRSGELLVSGEYYFANSAFLTEIDSVREAIIQLFNEILNQAHLGKVEELIRPYWRSSTR